MTTYDHANEAFDTGHILDNTLSVSGGNDRTTFYLSGNYNHNEGVFVGPNNYFDRAHGAPQRVAPSDRRPHARRQLLVRRHARSLDAARQQRERPAPRAVPHAAGLQQPAVPRSDDRPASVVHGSGRRRSETAGPDAHVQQSVLHAERRAERPEGEPHLRQRQRASTSRTAGSSSTTRSAPTTRTTSASKAVRPSAPTSRPAAASPRASSSTIRSITTSRRTATWHLNDNFGGTVTLGQNLNARNFRTFSVVGRTLIAPQPFSILNTLTRDPAERLSRRRSTTSRTSARRRSICTTSSTSRPRCATTGRRRSDAATGELVPEGERRVDVHELLQAELPDVRQSASVVRRSGAGAAAVPHVGDVQRHGPRRRHLAGHGLHADAERPRRSVHELHQAGDARCIPSARRSSKAASTSASGARRPTSAPRGTSSQTSDVILVLPTAPSSGFSQRGEERRRVLATAAPSFRSTCVRSRGRTMRGTRVRLGTQPVERRRARRARSSCSPTTSLIEHGRAGRPAARRDSQPGLGALRHQRQRRDLTASISRSGLRQGKAKGTLYIDDGTHDGCGERRHAVRRSRHERIIGDPNPKWTGNVHSSFSYKKSEFSALARRQEGRRRLERHAGRAVQLRHARGHGEPRDVHRRRERRAARATCTRSASPDFYPGPVTGPGAGQKIPVGENWYRNERARRVSVHGHRRAVHRGRRLREAARDLGRLHVRQPWVESARSA